MVKTDSLGKTGGCQESAALINVTTFNPSTATPNFSVLVLAVTDSMPNAVLLGDSSTIDEYICNFVSITDTICLGDSLELIAGGGSTYLWSTGDTTQAIWVSPGSTSSYSVEVADENGCNDTASITIMVDSLSVTITEDTSIGSCTDSATIQVYVKEKVFR